MRRVFIDTNIMMDLLGERDPYYQSIAKIATLAESGKLTMVASPLSFATVTYFLSKFETNKIAREKLRKFKIISEVCSIDEQIIDKGLNSGFKDFEDALQYHCAVDSGCEIILTRNGRDFTKSQLPIMSADEFLNSISK